MVSACDIFNAKILVVDDQETNVRLLKKTLRGAGYASISSTMDPHKVCELHRINNYDLILLDLEMPGLDGFQVMEGLKEIETNGYLPVLVITAQLEHKLRALQFGAKDFVSKPFDLAEVLARANNLIEVRQLHAEARNHAKILSRTLQEVEESHELIRRLNESLHKHTVNVESENENLESYSHSVSHDLRSPLRLSSKIAHLLLRDYATQLPADVKEKIHMILVNTEEMSKLIEDILMFSQVNHDPMKKKLADLKQLAHEALADLQDEQQGRKVKFVIDDLPPCQANDALMKLALLNLFANALKFTRTRDIAEIQVGFNHANGETVYFVRDNGVGFDMNQSESMFLAFSRLHPSSQFEGSGVGLALVKRIIERHGGRIWALSEIGQGATFFFTLE